MEERHHIRIEVGGRIPLRDGVKLSAIIFKPTKIDRAPTILTMTPYGADRYVKTGDFFARHGYVFVIADVRGRGNSEGTFRALAQEKDDVADVIEWIADQPWCSSELGMWGGSYAGFSQWAAIRCGNEILKTIVPVASAFPGIDVPFWRNIINLYEFQWQALTHGVTDNPNLAGFSDYWKQIFWYRYENNLPFSSLPELAGYSEMPVEWMQHPCRDDYWDEMVPTDAEFSSVDMPILSITGHYDADQAGALEYFQRHTGLSSRSAQAKHYLLIGPWDHAGTRNPRREVGGLTFGEASQIDLNELQLQWFDWVMKDGVKPQFLRDRITYYVAGSEQWRYASSLAEVGADREKQYLSSNSIKTNAVRRYGQLTQRAPRYSSRIDQYHYDPLDTRQGHWELTLGPNYLSEESRTDPLFGNGVVYESDPFDESLEIAGFPRCIVWMSLNVPDTDFEVILSVIDADNQIVLLSRDMQRARYRKSLREAEFVHPGTIEAYKFTGFTFVGRFLHKGCRLRLTLRSPNSIYIQKNYNNASEVIHEGSADARLAEITIFHGQDYPSYLEVPVNKCN